MSSVNVSLVQTHTHWHDPAANRALFDIWLDEVPQGTHLVVLPEMFSTGFTMAGRQVAETMDGETIAWMRSRAASLDAVVCGSLVIADGPQVFNRMLWVEPGGSVTSYDKRHLFRMAQETDHYAAGTKRVVVELNGLRLCLAVCYDLRFPVWLRNRRDYDALVVVANWPAARVDAWLTLLRARAIENQAYVVGVNILGEDGAGVVYNGGSAVYDFVGTALVPPSSKAEVVSATLDLDQLAQYREEFPAWQDADEFTVNDSGE